MKLTARKDTNLDNDYVDVKYREITPTIHKIFQLCEETGSILLCEKDGVTYKVDANDILYIEWVDGRSCIYTKEEVLFMPVSLKNIEDSLKGEHFIRISKMALLNVYKIKSISNGMYFRLIAEMVNGEKIVVGRRYREDLIEAINKIAKEVLK